MVWCEPYIQFQLLLIGVGEFAARLHLNIADKRKEKWEGDVC